MNSSPIQRVPLQDQGSKLQCVKFAAMKIIPIDRLHQEYLTIDLKSTNDWWQIQLGERQGPWLTHSLTETRTESLTYSLSTENVGTGAVCCQFTFQTLHATSQDGSSLKVVAATASRECNIQDARVRGLWLCLQMPLAAHLNLWSP